MEIKIQNYSSTHTQKNLLVSIQSEWKHLPLSPLSSSNYNTIVLNISSAHIVIHISFTLCLDHPTEFGKLKSKRKVYYSYPSFGSFNLPIFGTSCLMFQDFLPLSKTSISSDFRIGLLENILFIFLYLTMLSFLTEIFVWYRIQDWRFFSFSTWKCCTTPSLHGFWWQSNAICVVISKVISEVKQRRFLSLVF